ncbi:MAG: isoprenoid biosynthesis glyoxalase ElbB [Candidatus Limimorpha sp.]
MKKVAVILAGCGPKDGSEIQETLTLLLALDQHNIEYHCFAPNENQYHVINHVTGETMDESRNVMVEAARIVRGDISPIEQFKADDFDALFFPGGFGAAKNLFSYAIDGANFTVNRYVEKAVKDMHTQNKPIGAMCISPIMIAKVLGNVNVTVGCDNYPQADDVRAFGCTHTETQNGGVAIDKENKVFTTPCYMLNATLKDIYDCAWNMVEAMKDL